MSVSESCRIPVNASQVVVVKSSGWGCQLSVGGSSIGNNNINIETVVLDGNDCPSKGAVFFSQATLSGITRLFSSHLVSINGNTLLLTKPAFDQLHTAATIDSDTLQCLKNGVDWQIWICPRTGIARRVEKISVMGSDIPSTLVNLDILRLFSSRVNGNEIDFVMPEIPRNTEQLAALLRSNTLSKDAHFNLEKLALKILEKHAGRQLTLRGDQCYELAPFLTVGNQGSQKVTTEAWNIFLGNIENPGVSNDVYEVFADLFGKLASSERDLEISSESIQRLFEHLLARLSGNKKLGSSLVPILKLLGSALDLMYNRNTLPSEETDVTELLNLVKPYTKGNSEAVSWANKVKWTLKLMESKDRSLGREAGKLAWGIAVGISKAVSSLGVTSAPDIGQIADGAISIGKAAKEFHRKRIFYFQPYHELSQTLNQLVTCSIENRTELMKKTATDYLEDRKIIEGKIKEIFIPLPERWMKIHWGSAVTSIASMPPRTPFPETDRLPIDPEEQFGADFQRKKVDLADITQLDVAQRTEALFQLGQQLALDPEKRAHYYELAAKRGHAQAQYEIGQCYAEGRGVGQDWQKAVEWLTQAMEKGVPNVEGELDKAQYELGKCYAEGRGVGQDWQKAFYWLAKAQEKRAVEQLPRKRIDWYIDRKMSDLQADLVKIDAEQVGLVTGEVALGLATFGVWPLALLIGDLPLNSVTRPKKEELDKRELEIPVEKIALQVLKKFYETDLSKVIEIATPLFALYYEKPCMLDAHACTVENGNVCFRVPSERTIDTIMGATGSQDTQWKEFHNKSSSDFEWRNNRSRWKIEKAIRYLEQHHRGIVHHLKPLTFRVVQAYSDDSGFRQGDGRDYSFMFS